MLVENKSCVVDGYKFSDRGYLNMRVLISVCWLCGFGMMIMSFLELYLISGMGYEGFFRKNLFGYFFNWRGL